MAFPGWEANAEKDPAVVLCRVKEGKPVKIKRATKLADGTLYLDVWVREQCYGWVPAGQVENYPLWRNDIAPGEMINHFKQ